MSSAATSRPATRDLPGAVVVAAVATGAGALPALLGLTASSLPVGAVYSTGWLAFGVSAAVLLDRDRNSRVGWVFVVLTLMPLMVVCLARARGGFGWSAWTDSWHDVGWLVVALAVLAVSWAVDLSADRMSRRRLVWVIVWSAALFGVIVSARWFTTQPQAAAVTVLGLWAFAASATRLEFSAVFRPIDEPLVDVAVGGGAVLLGGVAGLTGRAVGVALRLPSPDASAAFVAIVSVAVCWPMLIWLRRGFVERRYGPGLLSPDDVAVITAGLHAHADPRELLGKAATMVSTASGHRAVSIVLGSDEPDQLEEWHGLAGWVTHHALVVGGERVGTLSILAAHREGPEPRQTRIVTQLLPTVALAARAVGLAVEAEHARQDVARERDAERTRILGDLHDGVGPVLAGMSMRVQAELRADPTPLLEALASGLADCRGDLRRIVSGLTPSALHDTELEDALRGLVDSFASDSRSIHLELRLGQRLAPEVSVAVYRSIAEGITNALRHGDAREVAVTVRTRLGGDIWVEVRDNGTGRVVVPGVGLTSLRRRAEQLGGRLEVHAVEPHGVQLHLELPASCGAAR